MKIVNFRKKMSVRNSYSIKDRWRNEYVCKIQMKVWLFWVNVKVMSDDDEEYLNNRADEVIGYLKD